MFAILLFAANQPEKLGTVWIDWVIFGLLIFAALCYVGVRLYSSRRWDVKFTPLRQTFDVMDDWTPEDHVQYFGRGDEFDPAPTGCRKCGYFDCHSEHCEFHPDNIEDAF